MITQHQAETAVLLVRSLVVRMLEDSTSVKLLESQIFVVLDELKRIEDYITRETPGSTTPGASNVINQKGTHNGLPK